MKMDMTKTPDEELSRKADRLSRPVVRAKTEHTNSYLAGPQKNGDVGHDLYVVIDEEEQTLVDKFVSWLVGRPTVVVWPLVGTRRVSSGVHLSMPNCVWCRILPRSSTSRNKLEILGGNIDSGYRGELYTMIHNFGFWPRLIKAGERYAQVIYYPAVRPIIQDVPEFGDDDASERGATGFGSTGA